MRLPAIVANMQRAGGDAIPIVALLAFLIAMAYQGAHQLAGCGAEIFTIQLTAVSLREMGALVTAILVAGARAVPSPRRSR